MSPLISVALFALGAVVASFVGVIVGRLGTGQSFVRGRSRCDACNAPLAARSLVPVISYFFSDARAHCCGARISYTSPLSEFLLGGLFVLTYFKVGLSSVLLFLLTAFSLLLALVLYDLAHQILPPAILSAFVVTSALTGFFLSSDISNFLSNVMMAVVIGGFLALIHFLSLGRAMGFSDAPLAFGLSLLTGAFALSGFIFSFWIGAVIGIWLLLKRPAGSRMGVEVPFAPYLAAGFLLAYFTQWNLFTLIAGLP